MDRAISAAVADGRINASRTDHYREEYAKDPGATRRLLTASAAAGGLPTGVVQAGRAAAAATPAARPRVTSLQRVLAFQGDRATGAALGKLPAVRAAEERPASLKPRGGLPADREAGSLMRAELTTPGWLPRLAWPVAVLDELRPEHERCLAAVREASTPQEEVAAVRRLIAFGQRASDELVDRREEIRPVMMAASELPRQKTEQAGYLLRELESGDPGTTFTIAALRREAAAQLSVIRGERVSAPAV